MGGDVAPAVEKGAIVEEHHEGTTPEEPTPAQPEPPAAPPQAAAPTPPTPSPAGSEETSSNMDPKLAALLAYLFGWIGGLIFYLIETKNKYVRFHALQSIFLSIAFFVVFVAISIITGILAAIPGVGLVMIFVGPLITGVLGLGGLVLWIMLMVKAYQGEKWMLPIIGELADKNS